MERADLYRRFVAAFHHGEPPVPASPGDIDEAERVLGTVLPGSYRTFMASFGAVYTPSLFDMAPGLPEMPDLQNLSTIKEVVAEAPRLWCGGTPQNLLVIGNDAMGNMFCLPRRPAGGARADDLPITFFDHEFLDVSEVATSFDHWLAGFLRLVPEER